MGHKWWAVGWVRSLMLEDEWWFGEWWWPWVLQEWLMMAMMGNNGQWCWFYPKGAMISSIQHPAQAPACCGILIICFVSSCYVVAQILVVCHGVEVSAKNLQDAVRVGGSSLMWCTWVETRLMWPGKSELAPGRSWESLGAPLEVSMEILSEDRVAEAGPLRQTWSHKLWTKQFGNPNGSAG